MVRLIRDGVMTLARCSSFSISSSALAVQRFTRLRQRTPSKTDAVGFVVASVRRSRSGRPSLATDALDALECMWRSKRASCYTVVPMSATASRCPGSLGTEENRRMALWAGRQYKRRRRCMKRRPSMLWTSIQRDGFLLLTTR